MRMPHVRQKNEMGVALAQGPSRCAGVTLCTNFSVILTGFTPSAVQTYRPERPFSGIVVGMVGNSPAGSGTSARTCPRMACTSARRTAPCTTALIGYGGLCIASWRFDQKHRWTTRPRDRQQRAPKAIRKTAPMDHAPSSRQGRFMCSALAGHGPSAAHRPHAVSGHHRLKNCSCGAGLRSSGRVGAAMAWTRARTGWPPPVPAATARFPPSPWPAVPQLPELGRWRRRPDRCAVTGGGMARPGRGEQDSDVGRAGRPVRRWPRGQVGGTEADDENEQRVEHPVDRLLHLLRPAFDLGKPDDRAEQETLRNRAK